MPDYDPYDPEIAAYIEECNAHLLSQVQAAGGWPKTLTLRRPATPAEGTALSLWVTTFREQTGAFITVSFKD